MNKEDVSFKWIFLKKQIHRRHIDANKTRYVESLREAVAIKSVSSWPQSRPDVGRMIDLVAEKLKALGAEVQLVELGTETLIDGQTLPLPKAILASLGNVCGSFKTIIRVVVKLKAPDES